MRRAFTALAVLSSILVVILLVVNCGGGSGVSVIPANVLSNGNNGMLPSTELIDSKQGFGLRTGQDGNGFAAGSKLNLVVTEGGQQTEVSVIAQASDMKLAQFEITYDGQVLHPISSEQGDWPIPINDQLVRLTILDVPNSVHHGAVVANPHQAIGANGEFTLLTVVFEAGAQTGLRQVKSAPSDASDSIPDLNVDTVTGDVTFSYYNTGDYDQNSEVNIADITPLAVNFGETGPFDTMVVESLVDGDGNGEINLADITPIAVNFLNDIGSWAVYAGALADYPDGASEDNGAASNLGDVLFSSATGNPAADRLTFAGQFPALIAPPELLAWVRPYGADGVEGVASAPFNLQTGVADGDPPVWDDTIGITAAGSGFGQVTVSWGPATDAISPPVTYVVYYNEGATVDFGTATTAEIAAPAINTVVTGLTDGIEYSFAVRAKDSAIPSNEDDNSTELTVIPGTDTTPPVWTGATGVGAMDVIPLDGGVRMVWGEATDADSPAVTYVIYYNEGDTVDLGTALVMEHVGTDPPDPVVDQFTEITGLANDTQYAFVVQAKDAAVPANQEGNANTVTTTPMATAEMPASSTGDTTFDGPMTVGLGNSASLNCDAGDQATFEFMSDLTIDGELIPTDCDITIIVHGTLTVNGSIDHQIADPQPDVDGNLPSLELLLLGDFETGDTPTITGQGNIYIVDDPEDLVTPEEAEADADNWDSDEFDFNVVPNESAGGGGSFKTASKTTSATKYYGPWWTWRPNGNWGKIPTPPRNVNRIVLRIYQRRGNTTASNFSIEGPEGAPGTDDLGNCTAVGGDGEDNRFKLRWHVGRRLTFNNVTIKLGDGGKGGLATTPGDCCDGTAIGGNGGNPNNKYRISAGNHIQINGSFNMNPGNGGIGGDATAFARDGVTDCPGEDGCDATALGGDGGEVPRWGMRHSGSIGGTNNISLGTAMGGDGGTATTTAGMGGDGLVCCDGGSGGLATSTGGTGGNSTFSGSTVGSGSAQGGDGGAGIATAKDGGKGGDCFKAQAGNGGFGGDADATGGPAGLGSGTGATDGTQGSADAIAGNGGDGGDGFPIGAGGGPGIPTADGDPANTNSPLPGADGIEWPTGGIWLWCIPLSSLVPDPALPGPIPDGYGSGPSDPPATIFDAVTLEPIGTVPFNWTVPFDGDAQWWPDPPQLQLLGGEVESTTIEIELVELNLIGSDPVCVNGLEFHVTQAFNNGTGSNIGEMVVVRPDETLIARMDVPPITFTGDPTPLKLDFLTEPEDINMLLRGTALLGDGFFEIWDAIYIWDP